jgi:hypothetical protein
MKYVTKKRAPKKLEPVKVEIRESPGYGKTVNNLAGLLVTTIKKNDEITRVHATQITNALSDIREMNAKAPVVTVKQSGKRTFHMDVNRGNNGFIVSVDGTIEG